MVVFEGCFGNVQARLSWLGYFDDRIIYRNFGRYRNIPQLSIAVPRTFSMWWKISSGVHVNSKVRCHIICDSDTMEIRRRDECMFVV
jgi:hypothetical protein